MDVFELKSNGPRKVGSPHGLEAKINNTYGQFIPFSFCDVSVVMKKVIDKCF